jgi:hypothetical protein
MLGVRLYQKMASGGERLRINALHDHEGVKLKTNDIPIQGTYFVAYSVVRFEHAAFNEK